MKKKSVSERVKERMADQKKVPAHQQGRMRSALIPGTEREYVDSEGDESSADRDRDEERF